MANVTEDQPQAQPVPEKKSRGCLFGCLIALGLMFGCVLCAGIGGYWFVTSQFAKYTSETPLDLPTVEYTPEKLAELQTRVKTFGDAAEGDTADGAAPPTELVLTADDINAMLSQDEKMKGRVYVKIAEGQISGDVSFPTDPIPGGKGRYFNGSATFDASMHDGTLIVKLTDAEVNGDQLPSEFIDAMAHENLAKDVYKNPEHAEVLRRFEDIAIDGDKVILRLKPKVAGENSDSPVTPTEPETIETTLEASETEVEAETVSQ